MKKKSKEQNFRQSPFVHRRRSPRVKLSKMFALCRWTKIFVIIIINHHDHQKQLDHRRLYLSKVDKAFYLSKIFTPFPQEYQLSGDEASVSPWGEISALFKNWAEQMLCPCHQVMNRQWRWQWWSLMIDLGTSGVSWSQQTSPDWGQSRHAHGTRW